MTRDGPWRLLIDGAADGAWNMAVDEAILEGYAAGAAPASPTLRLYSWNPATLSLGKGQPAPGDRARAYLRRFGLGLVRRPTGGQAVLHDVERTYAVIGRLGARPFPRGVNEVYREIAAALQEGLRLLGLSVETRARSPVARPRGPVCFATAASFEPTVDGKKLVGSAQLRRRGAFLQHGSIPRRLDAARLAAAAGLSADPGGWVDLERALGRLPTAEEVDGALVAGFERHFAVRCRRQGLDPAELARARERCARRYRSRAWTLGALNAARESSRDGRPDPSRGWCRSDRGPTPAARAPGSAAGPRRAG